MSIPYAIFCIFEFLGVCIMMFAVFIPFAIVWWLFCYLLMWIVNKFC